MLEKIIFIAMFIFVLASGYHVFTIGNDIEIKPRPAPVCVRFESKKIYLKEDGKPKAEVSSKCVEYK